MKRNAILVIFIAMAAAAALLAYFFTPPRPETVLAAAFSKIRGAKHVSGVVTVGALLPGKAVPGADAAAPDIPIILHGAVQFDLPEAGSGLIGETALDVVGSGQGGGKDVLFEMKSLTNGAFVRISGLPKAQSDLAAKMDDAWYSLDLHTLGSIAAAGGTAGTDDGGVGGADAAAARDAYARIRAKLGDGSMFTTDGGAGTEMIAGAAAYKFVFDVDPDSRAAFAEDLRVILLGRPLRKDEAARVAVDAKSGDVLVTFWVDRRTSDLRKIAIDLFAHGAQGGVTSSFRIEQIDLAAPADVSAPPLSKPFADVLAEIRSRSAAAPQPPSASGKNKKTK